MRCLAKNISVSTGLGLYIYKGQDLPQAEVEAQNASISKEQAMLVAEALVHSGADTVKFHKFYGIKDVREIKVAQYDQVMHGLEKKIAQNAATEQQ